MSDILLHLLPQIVASLLYAALGLHFWHTRWREIGKPVDLLPMQPWERMAIGVALVFQGIGLYEGLFSAGGMRFSFSLALSLMFWMAVLIYWLESFRLATDGAAAGCVLFRASSRLPTDTCYCTRQRFGLQSAFPDGHAGLQPVHPLRHSCRFHGVC